jgi:UDP-glucose 4-epimerase
VIRFANIYGPRACINSPEFTFNNYFIGLALQNKGITVFGEGEQKRNVMYVDDAISSLIAVSRADNIHGETFFAVGDEHFSVADIARITVEIMGTGSVKFIPWPSERKSIEIGDAIITAGKLKKCTDWKPKYNMREGLTLTKEYYAKCISKYIC